VGKCSCESFESTVRICSDEAAVQCTGGSHQQHCRYLRAVTSPEPDVLVTHLAIRRAGDARRARLGMHGLADNGCARALFGSVTPQAASGCSASLQRGQVAPCFSCLASAAGCYCLFIDSSERAWGTRAPQRPAATSLRPKARSPGSHCCLFALFLSGCTLAKSLYMKMCLFVQLLLLTRGPQLHV